MPLDILSIAIVSPGVRAHHSRLGSAEAGAYLHLHEPAGRFSRPNPADEGGLDAPYDAPAAAPDQRCSDLAAAAATAAAAGLSGEQPVSGIFHAQCTLDQQILGSACLRLQAEVFDGAAEAMSVGQAGTAGVAVAMALADLVAGPGHAVAISAADKWIAPFFRKRGSVALADGGACCIVGRSDRAIARIVALHNLVGEPLADFWQADGEAVDRHVADLAVSAIADLRGACLLPADTRIFGDAPGSTMAASVAAGAGLYPLAANGTPLHFGSAAMIAAIDGGIAVAVEEGREIPIVVWTACPSGHAAAALVVCMPTAVATDYGWTLHPALNG